MTTNSSHQSDSDKKETRFWEIEPECSATLGENTQLTASREVIHLHLEFEGWLGDDLGGVVVAYYVTEKLKDIIEQSPLTGGTIEDTIEITKSEQLEEMEPDFALPKFYMLVISGEGGIDDIGLAKGKVSLILSDRAVKLFQQSNIQHATLKPWPPKGFF